MATDVPTVQKVRKKVPIVRGKSYTVAQFIELIQKTASEAPEDAVIAITNTGWYDPSIVISYSRTRTDKEIDKLRQQRDKRNATRAAKAEAMKAQRVEWTKKNLEQRLERMKQEAEAAGLTITVAPFEDTFEIGN